MVIGNLTRKERVFDILADIRDLHTIQDKDKRIQQLESIAESIGEIGENRIQLQNAVLNYISLWNNESRSECYCIHDDINSLHDYTEQSLRSKTIASR